MKREKRESWEEEEEGAAMEMMDDNGFLEELLSLRRDTWDSFPPAMADLFPPECFDPFVLPPPDLSVPVTAPLPYSPPPNGEVGLQQQQQQQKQLPATLERKVRARKAEGQPSKNLMAERRRRKRLNDRLSMLRSVVPKISKMDRTSILGDTIDYMKELLGRIKGLQGEIETTAAGAGEVRAHPHHHGNLLGIFKEINADEVLVRNTPQFEVERRDVDTRVEICCAGKPGLLLSTVSTLEALGLEIQQCVASCFNDFGLQASCSERVDQRAILRSEEIKQALFRNAGYGGRYNM